MPSTPHVVHLFRAPFGGLFRHVRDLTYGQERLGLKIGLICERDRVNEYANSKLTEIESVCELGVHRIPMGRRLGWSDLMTLHKLKQLCRSINPDIIHGHGAKGGAYARILSSLINAKSVYTPHGGSLHFSQKTPNGFFYLTLENLLRRHTDGLIFESQFSAQTFRQKIGAISCTYQIVYNGLHDWELDALTLDKPSNTFVFIGELRKLKGIDILLQAHAKLLSTRDVKLLVVGSGPDSKFITERIKSLGLTQHVRLSPPIFPAQRTFAQGQCVVVPSLAESFPYIVLEAAAAKVPVIATKVGGIPEIFGPYSDRLLPPGDVEMLTNAMMQVLDDPVQANQFAGSLQRYVKEHFTVEGMVQATVQLYDRVLNGQRN